MALTRPRGIQRVPMGYANAPRKMDRINLPEEVLTRQICTNCGQYLSVGPVTISSGEGGVVCGRCPKDSLAVNSLYNIIAERCWFKCVKHYGGCEQLLLFTEVKNHEQNCKHSEYACPFCKYRGNGCQLVLHFNKFHANYVKQGDTFTQIISYKDLDIANHISNMIINDLKLFVNTASKLFMQCVNCEIQFREESTVYVCPKYHAACVNCCLKKCSKCCKYCLWNTKSRLHSTLLECEWENCNEKRTVFTYLRHKQVCKFRQYRCPDEDCGYVCNLEELRKHWHVSPMKVERAVHIELLSSIAFYWLTPYHNDLLYVTVENDPKHELTIAVSEINSVVPFNFELILKDYSGKNNTTPNILTLHELRYNASKPVRYMKFFIHSSYQQLYLENLDTKFDLK